MKTNFTSNHKACAFFIVTVLLLTTVPSLTNAAPATPPSPVGSWECITSGAGQPGIAFLTFSNDFTFAGDMIVAGTPPSPSNNPRSSSASGRGGGSTPVVATTNLFGYWQVEGPWGFDIKGHIIGNFIQIIKVAPQVTVNWNKITVNTGPILFNVDDYGTDLITVTQPVSFFVDSSDGTQGYPASTNFVRTFIGPSSTRTYNWMAINTNDGYTNNYTANLTFFNNTNFLYQGITNFSFSFASNDLITNITWSVTGPNGYVNNYSYLFYASNTLGYSLSGVVTNRVSFIGTVTPGKRLTLRASTSLGGNNLVYSGVPMNPTNLTDISGHWTGAKLEDKVNYIEFFDVTPTSFPYLFLATGEGVLAGGAGYDVNGLVMVSSRKRIAFSEFEHRWGETNDILRASIGSFSISKKAIIARTKGLDETGSTLLFNATQVLP